MKPLGPFPLPLAELDQAIRVLSAHLENARRSQDMALQLQAQGQSLAAGQHIALAGVFLHNALQRVAPEPDGP